MLKNISHDDFSSSYTGWNRSLSGLDRKFPHTPGTNQIAEYAELRLVKRLEKIK